ncbi:MAG: PIN domain-containing protein [Patescibacteria group bacterium]|nr:PIN domain-containing protein [Patescibacteria group bacterium]
MREDSKIYFIDTNIFIRILFKENERIFQDCLSVLKLVKNDKITAFICSLVIAEIDWVLERVYKISKHQVVNDLQSIFKLKNLKICDKNDLKLAIYLYKRYNVKFIDAIIASNDLIQKKSAIIVSYDKDFDKLGVKRIEPKKLLKKL